MFAASAETGDLLRSATGVLKRTYADSGTNGCWTNKQDNKCSSHPLTSSTALKHIAAVKGCANVVPVCCEHVQLFFFFAPVLIKSSVRLFLSEAEKKNCFVFLFCCKWWVCLKAGEFCPVDLRRLMRENKASSLATLAEVGQKHLVRPRGAWRTLENTMEHVTYRHKRCPVGLFCRLCLLGPDVAGALA